MGCTLGGIDQVSNKANTKNLLIMGMYVRYSLFYILTGLAVLLHSHALAQQSRDSTITRREIFDIKGSRTTVITNQKEKSKKLTIKDPAVYDSYYTLDEMASCGLLVGNNSNGLTASLFMDSYRKGRFALPFVLSLDYIYLFKTAEASQYQTGSTSYAKLGTEAWYCLNKYFWLCLTLQIPFGEERLADLDGNSVKMTVIGISTAQSIRFISPKKSGITFSVGLFQQLITSNVQPGNIGVKFDVGIKL